MSSHEKAKRIPLNINAFEEPVFILDSRGRFDQLSQSCRDFFGRELRELRGLEMASLLPDSQRPEFLELLESMREESGPRSQNLQIFATRENTHTVRVSLAPLRNAGRLQGYQGIVQRAAATAAGNDQLTIQRRRLSLLDEIGENLQGGAPLSSVLQDALKAIVALSSYGLAAAYSRKADRLLARWIHQGDADLFPEAIALDGSAAALLPASYLEHPRVLDSASPVNPPALFDFMAQQAVPSSLLIPLLSRDRLQGFILLASRTRSDPDDDERLILRRLGDLFGQALAIQNLDSEIEALSTRLSVFTESSTDHIWETDAQGLYTYNSPSIKILSGHAPEEARGRSPVDFIHPEDREETRQYLLALMQEKKILRGLVSRILNTRGETIYVETRAFPIIDASGEVVGYRGVDRNISDWFESKHVLERTLVGTCEALSRMVELRDPYTKGHSVRVAELMVKIGEAMNRNEYDLQGLRLMGLLHDIGKIGIPTEILSKPSRLSSEEIELMRQHPGMGYEILKDIPFPWPVSAAALQHHERLDGTGYPQGLGGEEIIWQVRLLAVVDLLEAMVTDRPYRPGLGLERALQELSRSRGILFDAEIVETVLALAARGELDAHFHRIPQPNAGVPGSNELFPSEANLAELMAAEEGTPSRKRPDLTLLTLDPEGS